MATASQPTHSNPPAAPAPAAPQIGLPAEALEPDISAVPPDFKLAKVGSKDWVAGQPIDQAEFDKTQAEVKKRVEEGRAAVKAAAAAAKAAHK